MPHFILLLLVVFTVAPGVRADKPRATATLIADAAAVAPGDTVTIGLRFKIDPKWHIYWLNPGDSGMATTFQLTGPEGCDVGPVQWPTPQKFFDGTFTTYGYEKEVLLMRTVRIPKTAKPGTTLLFNTKAEWLVCDKEACIAGDAQLTTTVTIDTKTKPANKDVFDAALKQLPASGNEAPAEFTFVLAPNAARPAGDATLIHFNLAWTKKVTNVDWYPAATQQMLVEDLKVETKGQVTKIAYKLTSLDTEGKRVDTVPGVLVFTDAKGVRRSRIWNGLGQPLKKSP